MSTLVTTTATAATLEVMATSEATDGQRRARLVDRMKFRPPASALTSSRALMARKHRRNTRSGDAASAAGPSRLAGRGSDDDDDEESSDQHSSPIGTFGAPPIGLGKRKHAAAAGPSKPARSTKRSRVQLVSAQCDVEEARHDTSGDIDVSDISCFPTLAPRSASRGQSEARREDEERDENGNIDEPGSRPEYDQDLQQSLAHDLGDDTGAAAVTTAMRTPSLAADEATFSRSMASSQAHRSKRVPDHKKQLVFRHAAPATASVRQDFTLSNSAASYRDALPDWASSASLILADEAADLLEFQPSGLPCSASFAGYAAIADARSDEPIAVSPGSCLNSANLLIEQSTWEARLCSPRARYEIVKLVVPISIPASHAAASDAIWLDANSTPAPHIQSEGPRKLAWLPGTFASFATSLADLFASASRKGRTESIMLGYTALRHRSGTPRQVTIYTNLDRLAELRVWLARLEVDAHGTRPFRLDGHGARLVVIDAKRRPLLVF
ncbi:uncharacterized protein PFL1_01940 [Pseudozyma flocculosa PF-1]|uniref:uncharacterized protein n=1 Tax=Pseudozyma flocculosa PF-1 TaxID=1277687 RepID=UPI00045601F1|nr:uncharacterized protein PFL1_01940 [Pseudozyma flocculosa PF-1]EPQ30414.1 hypothetical protein PFL1_01940 [Pseudozyma flocculosa PF-1]